LVNKKSMSKRDASGTLLVCKTTGRFLLIKRGRFGSYPGRWAIVGGGIDPGEEPLEAAKRELWEETQINPTNIEYEFFELQNELGTDFYFFIGYCDEEFECRLNDENTDWGWFDMNTLPSPLIPLMKKSLNEIFN
jgi:8-oxo-dGTP pyrophosphatase MutT (NUDIX family)